MMLRAFLAAPVRPAETLQYHQLQGFLFAVSSAPELIRPSQWMPIVFSGHDAGYRSIAEARSITGTLMAMYNDINTAILDGVPALPADCPFRADPLENLEPAAPISQWSQGFSIGHDWLREAWMPYIPEDDDEFGTLLLVLSFFSWRRLAEAYLEELELPGSLAAIATTMRDLLPDAMCDYATLGRNVTQTTVKRESLTARTRRKPGRRRRRT